MHYPILVVEQETKEILIFKSLAEAESYIEPPDIHIYAAYDAVGECLSIKQERVTGRDRVKLIPIGERQETELHSALIRYLNIVQPQLATADLSLEALTNTILKFHQGFSR